MSEMAKVITLQVPSEAAKVLRRRVYEHLEDVYSSEHKRYSGSGAGRWNDAKVAAKFECAEELVEKIREEFFGPDVLASEPTEQIKEMQVCLAEMRSEVERLINYASGLGTQAKALRKQSDIVEKQLKDLCAEHGWGF